MHSMKRPKYLILSGLALSSRIFILLHQTLLRLKQSLRKVRGSATSVRVTPKPPNVARKLLNL